MAKKKVSNNPIALPLDEYKDKIDELQTYLKNTKIKGILDYKERHDEIRVQLAVMKDLPSMLREYKELLIIQEEAKDVDDIRGDVELSPLEKGEI